jgi:hypothetical protein
MSNEPNNEKDMDNGIVKKTMGQLVPNIRFVGTVIRIFGEDAVSDIKIFFVRPVPVQPRGGQVNSELVMDDIIVEPVDKNQTDGEYNIIKKRMDIIGSSEFGWNDRDECFDLAKNAAHAAVKRVSSEKANTENATIRKVKEKKYGIGDIWKEAPYPPSDYKDLSIRKDVAENMIGYIKDAIDMDIPVVVGVAEEREVDVNEKVTAHFLVIVGYTIKDGAISGFTGIDNGNSLPVFVDFKVNPQTFAIEKPKPVKKKYYPDNYKYTITQVRLWGGVNGLEPKTRKGVWEQK